MKGFLVMGIQKTKANKVTKIREQMKKKGISFVMLDKDTSKEEAERMSEFIADSFLSTRDEFVKGEQDKIEILFSAVNELEMYFMYQSFTKKAHHNVTESWVYDLLHDIMLPKIETIAEKEVLGALVQILVLLGSSRKQAIQGVAEWTNKSESNIRNANEKYRIKHGSEVANEILVHFYRDFSALIKRTPRAFPNDAFKKAGNAYEILLREVNEMSEITKNM